MNTPDGIDEDLDFKDWDLNTAPYAYVTVHTSGAINTAINGTGVDTVLYHEAFGSSTLALHNSGKTLYLTQTNDAYIRFTDDTKVVFEQENKNEWTTEFWSGQSGVEKAIKELRVDETTSNYDYEVSALIDNGRASTIIIMDNTNNGDAGVKPTAGTKVIKNGGAGNNYAGTEIYGGGKTLSNYELMMALANQIEADGYNVTYVDATTVRYDGPNGYPTSVALSNVYQVYKVTAKMANTFADAYWNQATVTVTDAADGDEYIREGMQTVDFVFTYGNTSYDMDGWSASFNTATVVGDNTPLAETTSATGVAGTNTATASRNANTTADVEYTFSQNW